MHKALSEFLPPESLHIMVRLTSAPWLEMDEAAVEQSMRRCLHAVLKELPKEQNDPREKILSVLCTDDAQIRELNAQWRGKDYPTNVLSFPAAPFPIIAGCENGDALPPLSLGDLVFAQETIAREAAQAHRSVEEHFLYLCIHGLLHLFGFDHGTTEEAETMEILETKILEALGVPDLPYLESSIRSRDAS